jgi:hypothetical protein
MRSLCELPGEVCEGPTGVACDLLVSTNPFKLVRHKFSAAHHSMLLRSLLVQAALATADTSAAGSLPSDLRLSAAAASAAAAAAD